MKRYILFWIIAILIVGSLYGQSPRYKRYGRIKGKVTVVSTGEPVIGANVLLKGTIYGGATNTQGEFLIPIVPPGDYVIRVSAIGYETKEKSIHISAKQQLILNFTLKETVIQMESVSITASRYRQAVNDVPVSISLMPSIEIRKRNIVSLDKALQYVPGVNALDGGQISIRGSSGFNWGMGSRVLVMVNGNPFMSGDMHGINWYALPTSNIAQIEVMKGSGSALYGSSAMGGVINIITKNNDRGNHINVQTFTGFYDGPSYKEWKWTDTKNHFEGTKVDIYTYLGPISTTLSSGFQMTTGYRENDDCKNFNFMTTMGYKLNSRLRADLIAGYGSNRGGMFIYWKGLENPYLNGSDPAGYKTRTSGSNTYIYPSISYVINDKMTLLLKGRYNKSHSEDHLKPKSGTKEPSEDTFRSSKVISNGIESQLNYQMSSSGIIITGCDFQQDGVNSIQYGRRRVSHASYYIQIEQRFKEKLKLTLGARYDGEKIKNSVYTGKLSRKFGLNFDFTQRTHFRFSLGEGFRVPAIGERFVSTFTQGLKVRENPDLKPEKSFSGEIGLRHNFSKSMNMDVAIFYTRYNDLIEPQLDTDPTDQSIVVRFKNVVKAQIMGLDLSYKTDWWSRLISTRVGYTYLDTKDLSPGKEYGLPLKYRSKHTIYISNDISMHPIIAGMDFRYLSKIQRVDEYHKTYVKDIDKRVPTYVVSVYFGISSKHYSLRFIVKNLFQYNYLSSPANMGPPRHAVIQLNVSY